MHIVNLTARWLAMVIYFEENPNHVGCQHTTGKGQLKTIIAAYKWYLNYNAENIIVKI